MARLPNKPRALLAPRWLSILCLGIVPGLAAGLYAAWPAELPLVLLLLLLGFHAGALRDRAPLHLSAAEVIGELAVRLPCKGAFRFADLGCGLGGVLRRLERLRPNGSYCGVELAPLSAACARLRLGLAGSATRVRWGDFQACDLGAFDVVYAYLSPQPMGELWRKARREMRAGTLFVSHRFEVPGVAPDQVIRLRGEAVLYLWRMPGAGA